MLCSLYVITLHMNNTYSLLPGTVGSPRLRPPPLPSLPPWCIVICVGFFGPRGGRGPFRLWPPLAGPAGLLVLSRSREEPWCRRFPRGIQCAPPRPPSPPLCSPSRPPASAGDAGACFAAALGAPSGAPRGGLSPLRPPAPPVSISLQPSVSLFPPSLPLIPCSLSPLGLGGRVQTTPWRPPRSRSADPVLVAVSGPRGPVSAPSRFLMS